MFGPYFLPPPKDLWTVDEVRDWCVQSGVRASVAKADGESAVRVTLEGRATTFTFPIPPGTLAWVLKGNP